MKPFFENELVTIYCSSCLDVIPFLSDGAFDLLITDPPWGKEWESNYRKNPFGKMVGDDSLRLGSCAIQASLRVMKNQKHFYVFGPFNISEMEIGASAELIWDKGVMGLGDLSLPFGTQHEIIKFGVVVKSQQDRDNGRGRLSAKMRKGSILFHFRPHGVGVRHPSEKPVSLIRELIESSSRFGETVFDPFGGTGSTAVAAILEGRKAITVEIEPKWCELIKARCQKAMDVKNREVGI